MINGVSIDANGNLIAELADEDTTTGQSEVLTTFSADGQDTELVATTRSQAETESPLPYFTTLTREANNTVTGTVNTGSLMKFKGLGGICMMPADTNVNWSATNPIIPKNVVILDSTQQQFKIGKGYHYLNTEYITVEHAKKLATTRTITVTGVAVGSISFDGSEDVTLHLSPGPDSALDVAPLHHTHLSTDITDFTQAISGKAELVHTHTVGDIENLQSMITAAATGSRVARRTVNVPGMTVTGVGEDETHDFGSAAVDFSDTDIDFTAAIVDVKIATTYNVTTEVENLDALRGSYTINSTSKILTFYNKVKDGPCTVVITILY